MICCNEDGGCIQIASQEAQQTYGKNITGMNSKAQQDIAGMNIAADE